jgi:hypothetical protein
MTLLDRIHNILRRKTHCSIPPTTPGRWVGGRVDWIGFTGFFYSGPPALGLLLCGSFFCCDGPPPVSRWRGRQAAGAIPLLRFWNLWGLALHRLALACSDASDRSHVVARTLQALPHSLLEISRAAPAGVIRRSSLLLHLLLLLLLLLPLLQQQPAPVFPRSRPGNFAAPYTDR